MGGSQSCVETISQVRLCALQIGVYNEPSLQRLDLILAEAGKNGVRIIFPFVNYWPDLGGMQWYVDQVRMHCYHCSVWDSDLG